MASSIGISCSSSSHSPCGGVRSICHSVGIALRNLSNDCEVIGSVPHPLEPKDKLFVTNPPFGGFFRWRNVSCSHHMPRHNTRAASDVVEVLSFQCLFS